MTELHLRLFTGISVRCRCRQSGLGDWGRVKSVNKDRKRLPKALACH